MADEQTNTNQPAADAPAAKVKTVAEHFPARRIFDTVDDASAFLNRQSEELSDFDSQDFAFKGIDEEGNFDPELYGDGTRIMVAKLMNRGEVVNGERQPSTVKAIVCTPVPTLDAILSDERGRDWADKILLKELNHVAVRPLRDADNLATALDQMPTSRDEYITSTRDAGGGIMEAFNELYKPINAILSKRVKSWDKAGLKKADLKKAMESKAYAGEYFPHLEDRGEADSLFVTACQIGIAAAKKKGLDPTIFQRWLDTRDQATLKATDTDEDIDLDVDALAADLLDDEDDAETPATETETETATA